MVYIYHPLKLVISVSTTSGHNTFITAHTN